MVTTKKHKYSRKNTLYKTDTLVFVDDNFKENIEPFRKHLPSVKSILVPNKNKISRKKTNNTLEHELIRLKYNSKSIGQGISIKNINKIINWSNQINTKPRTILFDWDKTISIVGGIWLPDKNKNNYSVIDAAHYFSGTYERFYALQKMFLELHKHNITCYIFTNNPYGSKLINSENFYYFLKIVQVLAPNLTENNIIFGNGNKVKTFKENKVLMDLYRSIS